MRHLSNFWPLVFFGATIAAAVSGGSAHYRHQGAAVLNDLSATPGKTNPVLTQSKLCSASFRTGPYRMVEESTKHQACAEYGLAPAQCTGQKVEIDHLISLELGGSNDLANLWPEPYLSAGGAKQKDTVENALHKAVCEGKVSLASAQKCIAQNWATCVSKLGIP